MRHTSLQLARAGAWRQTRRRLRHLRDWPGNTGSPYSPVFSIGLLLIIALAANLVR
ncbi:MAG: hypothetical protein ACLQDM_04905 [Bradyrhizobium sp.]